MFLYYRIQQLLRLIDFLPKDLAEMFDLGLLVLDYKRDSSVYLVPMKEGLIEFLHRDEALAFLNDLSVPESFKRNFIDLMLISGEDFDFIEGKFTKQFVIENLDKFMFDGTVSRMVFFPTGAVDKSPIRFCCGETVGDIEDRIADAYKMIEVLLLLVTNNLTEDQKQEFIDIIDSIVPGADLVVTKKYFDPVDFTSVFLNKQKKIRQILDRKS